MKFVEIVNGLCQNVMMETILMVMGAVWIVKCKLDMDVMEAVQILKIYVQELCPLKLLLFKQGSLICMVKLLSM